MSLLETVFSKNNFSKAWIALKVKGKSGGLDNVSIAEYESNLDKNLAYLQNEVIESAYIPEPYKRIFIEKNNYEYRPLSLLTIKDKVVQLCFQNYYREKIEKVFADTSYAYRANKGHNKAINRIQDFIQRGNKWVCPIDIDNYFDSVNHNILMDKCRILFNDNDILRLIEMWIKIGYVHKGKYRNINKGIAQGGIISPMFSNIYLDCYDKEMKTMKYDNVRYADNILLIAQEKEKLAEALHFTKNYLRSNLSLSLNFIQKESVNVCSDFFTFCGIRFVDRKRIIDPLKFDKIKKEIMDIVYKENIRNSTTLINNHIAGIKRYYAAFDTEEQLTVIQEHLLNQLLAKIKNELQNKTIASISEAKSIICKISFLTPNASSEREAIFQKITENVVTTEKERNHTSVKHAISQKKRQYQKYWYENLDILISGAFSQIGKSGSNITVRKDGKLRKEIAIQKVKNILISAKAVTISSDAVKLCSENNIRINYFDELGRPYASVISSASPLSAIMSKQVEVLSSIQAKVIARNIIHSKIRNQLGLIKYFLKNKNSLQNDPNNIIELQRIAEIAVKVKEIDLNQELPEIQQKLMGLEGAAATSYWKLFRCYIPSSFSFEQREHQHAENIVNIMLNYAYGILYSRILSAVTLFGLNPNISFIHSEQKNKPTLIFDLIEQFRAPVADRTVIAILQKGIKVNANKNILADETKSMLAQKVLYRLNAEFIHKGKVTSYNEILIEQVKDLVAYIKGEKKVFKTFLLKW